MATRDDEEDRLRTVALQNAKSILTVRQRADAAMRKQAECLRITLASIGDAVISTDAEGRVAFMNVVAELLTGWRQDEALGHPLIKVFHIVNERTRQPVENPAMRALREGTVTGLANHTVLISRDGIERPIDDSAAPMRDESGAAIGAVLVFRDVTERKRAAEVTALLASIVESSEDAIVSKTLDGIIRTWNLGAEHIFGYTRAEAVGQPITLIIPPELHDEERAILSRLRRGERIEHFETIRVAKDGRRLDISLTVSPLRDHDGRVTGASKVARDVTDRKRAEKLLKQSEEYLRAVVQTTPACIKVVEKSGTIVDMNPRGLALVDAERLEDVKGRSVYDFVNAKHREEYRAFHERICRGAKGSLEFEAVGLRGSCRRMETHAAPLQEPDGSLMHLAITHDITDRKQTEETTRFLADASAALAELTDYESTLQKVASLAVPFFADWCAVDMQQADGSIRRLAVMHADPEKVELAHELSRRFPSRSADQSGVAKVLRTGVPECMANIPDSLLTESTRDAELLQIIRQLRLKSYICVPLRSRERTLGALTFLTAESGRSYGPNDLRAAEDLAHRAVIAIENANLVAALKESDRRKDEFLAMLAHELRNPLAPIRNALDMMRIEGSAAPQVQWARDLIGRQMEQMTRLVDDLLDVSRITRGKIELRTELIELAGVVASAVEASKPLVDERKHELRILLPSEPIYLDADPTRLAQVLLNLLNNAAKYMEPGGRIELRAERLGNQASIHVKDAGFGISAEMLPRIFEMFAQADPSLEGSQGGLGIGLTLVQRLVEMHKGTVSCQSDGLGRGSEFTVCLPVADGAAGAPIAKKAAERQPAASPSFRILIVDDNRDGADSLGRLLGTLGHDVRTAYDGLAAIETAAAFGPEVSILDIGLPKLNGYDTARRMRADHGKGLILIALTGWGQERDRVRSRDAGFNYHLTKPIEFESLRKLLAELKVNKV